MIDTAKIKTTIEILLEELGIDQTQPGFIETPWRVAKFWKEFIDREPPVIKTFPSASTDLIQLNRYTTWGLCPHHLLPVRYQVSVSYVPREKVFGISKLPRIVDYLLKDLPLQEDLPRMVVNYLHGCLDVCEAHCVVEGLHLCMTMRGVKAKDCTLTTTASLRREDYLACQSSK
jgi:GTP cyclohydrolase I